MIQTSDPEHPTLRAALDDIVRTHGRLTVLVALLRRPARQVQRPGPDLALSDHLRRDIGLDPLGTGWDRLR